MVSSSEGWAVGRDEHGSGLMLHLFNGKWAQVKIPSGTPWLYSVFMLSASDGWAVGRNGAMLHYTGGQWVNGNSGVASPLNSIAMLSATDGWAVGVDSTVLHYTGGVWTPVTTSIPVRGLMSISMASPTEGWAVGAGVIAQYHNGAWTALNPSAPPSFGLSLASVALVSASEGWAVGRGTDGAIILHYSNGQWLPAAISWIGGRQMNENRVALAAVAMVSPAEGWAVGYDNNANSSVILHYTQGAWTQVQTPLHASLMGISMVSASEGWAVGDQNTLLHYQNGAWSVYQS